MSDLTAAGPAAPGRFTLPRPEIVRDAASIPQVAVVEKPLSAAERLFNRGWLRKLLILVALAVVWETYARVLDNDLLFPTLTATLHAFADGVTSGVLPQRAAVSLRVLLMGYGCGVALAALLTAAPSASTASIGLSTIASTRSMSWIIRSRITDTSVPRGR